MTSNTSSANTVPHELFTLDSLASTFIEAWSRGSELPPSQKEKLLCNAGISNHLASPMFYQSLQHPEKVPIEILRRLQLVWLCTILDKSLWNNDLETLNNAYRVFKAMEFPPDLEYSDEFLDLLVDFKTQLFIGNLMQNSHVYDDALNSFARNLQILDRDESKIQIINKKWMAKCNRRRKDIDLLGSFQQMVKAWPESQFLERMKSLLMITGAYLNQKYPASDVRRRLKKSASKEIIQKVEDSLPSAPSSSVALTDDNSVQLQTGRKLPKGFEKPKVDPHMSINHGLGLSASTDALNQFISNVEQRNLDQNVSQIRFAKVPISEYGAAFDNLKSLYTLDHSDLSSNMQTGGALYSDKKSIKNELVYLKKKIEVVYDGYAALQKYLNFLKDLQRSLESKLQPVGPISNELPWTDDEEESLEYIHNDADKEHNLSATRQKVHDEEESSERINMDSDDEYELSGTHQNAADEDELEDEVLEVSEEDAELFEEEDDSTSNEALCYFKHHLPKLTPSSPARNSRRTPQKTDHAKSGGSKVQLACYNGKDVYELKCNNVFVFRRVSDGWANASTILQASSRDESEKVMIEEGLPEPKEIFKGSRNSKLRGTWIPVKTAKKLASYLDLDKELEPLFSTNDIDELEDAFAEETPRSLKRPRAEEPTEDIVVKTRKRSISPKSKEKTPTSTSPRIKVESTKITGEKGGNQFEQSRRSRSKRKDASEIEPAIGQVQLAAYNGKDVYEIKCNKVFVLRRVSDGWVNATTIFEASRIGNDEIAAINLKIPEPKEILVGNKKSKLHGMWYVFFNNLFRVPVETAKTIARSCKLQKELSPLLTYSL